MADNISTPVDKEGWASPILLLTWVAGTVDAIGYLGLGHVFTANMTGNAVLFALGGFILGVTRGVNIAHRAGTDVDQRRAFVGPVIVEGLVLAAFAVLLHLPMIPRNQNTLYILIGLSAVAMGVQSAAVRRLNLPGIATTVLTGTIISLVAGLVRLLHITYVSSLTEEPAASAPGRRRHLKLQAGVFIVYVAAAAAAAIFEHRVPLIVGLSPVVAVGLVLFFATSSAARPK